jgi:A/G-specific adenine glycosylase
MKASELTKTCSTLLSKILHTPVQSANGKAKLKPGSVRVVDEKPAGNVVHVFSHLRKTYRVQWVILEGESTGRPRLPQSSLVEEKKLSPAVKWVLIDDVKKAK